MFKMALLGLLANRFRNLVLEVGIGLHDIPPLGHGLQIRVLIQPPIPSTVVTSIRMTWSASRKNIEASATITNTMAVVTAVSRREGQVTLRASVRTSFRNWKGLTFGIVSPVKWQYSPRRRIIKPNGREFRIY